MGFSRKRKGGSWFNKPWFKKPEERNERDTLLTVPDDLEEVRMENDALEAAKQNYEQAERLRNHSRMTQGKFRFTSRPTSRPVLGSIREGGATRKRRIMRKRLRCSKRSRYV